MRKWTVIIPLCMLLFSAGNHNPGKYSIHLRWYKTYEGETWQHAETGLLWSLSYLGAMLPKGCKEKLIVRDADSVSFMLNLSEAGFHEEALVSWKVILDSLKQSEEYKKTDALDMGRFIMLTQNSPWHYYKITGAIETIGEFKTRHGIKGTHQYLVQHSSVSKGERLVSFAPFTAYEHIAFTAQMGPGQVEGGYDTPTEYEVFDVMPNGQLRFAVYGENGKLKPASDTSVSLAGKPSKCLWCHESSLQPLFNTIGDDREGFMPAREFLTYIDTGMYIIRQYRSHLETEINFNNTHHHTWSELNYTAFMNPTGERITNEFGCSIDEARKKTKDLSLHDDPNFPFYYRTYPYFGLYKDLFSRHQVDSLLPYRVARVPMDPLETGDYEPNFFK